MNRAMKTVFAVLTLALGAAALLSIRADVWGAPPRAGAGEEASSEASEELRARRAAVDETDAGELYRLALWAEQNGLRAGAREVFARVLAVDPDHKWAREKLGYELVDGLWLRGPAAMRAKGFVLEDGRWVLETTVDKTAERHRELQREAGQHLVALTSPDERTRVYAKRALEAMPPKPLLRPMIEVLHRGSVPARLVAIETLGERIGSDEAIAAVIRSSVMDQDESVRDAAVSQVAALGAPDVIYPYLRALNSRYAAVRTNAAHAIGNLGDLRGVETVIKRVNVTAGGGPRVNFQSLTQISYIRDFDVEIAQASQVGDPIVGIAQEGVILDIRVFKVEREMTVIEKRALTGALRKLTGEDFGDDTKAWTSWWRKNEAKLRAEAAEAAEARRDRTD